LFSMEVVEWRGGVAAGEKGREARAQRSLNHLITLRSKNLLI
jgi:hypothetical protein